MSDSPPPRDRKPKKKTKQKHKGENVEDRPAIAYIADRKRRHESDANSLDEITAVEGQETERAIKKRRKEEKRAKKSAKAAEAEAVETNGDHADVEDAALAVTLDGKKEGKRKKKDKRANEVADTEEGSAATGKAARKAERAAKRKAEKNADALGTNGVREVQKDCIRHNDYTQLPELTHRPQADIDAFIKNHSVAISDKQSLPLRPILEFSYLPPTKLLCHDVFKKFKVPTAIQSASWPYAFASRDVVGIAETGSGKTLAFGLPLARDIRKRLEASGEGSTENRRAPMALVLTPTRELAIQIHEQLSRLAASNAFNCALAYGGVDKSQQSASLRKVHCLVATPGRLKDFLAMGKFEGVDLSRCRFVVLDEADRMLDKGFEDDAKEILGACPSRADGRQTLMYTATWPQSIQSLAAVHMHDPVKITLGDRGEAGGELRANERIKQVVEVVDPKEKLDRLKALLKEHTKGARKTGRILVFCLYKKEAARIEDFIRSKGHHVGGIHGDLSQSARSTALTAFKDGSVPILVATDVAARGLDIPAVKLVLNYTFPLTVEDYVHRIGRTGRAGQAGLAITLFSEHEKGLAGGLVNVLKAADQDVPEALSKFGGTVKKKAHDLYGAFTKGGMEGQTGTKITFD